MKQIIDAYLDIETTGLSRWNAEITVIGVYLVGDNGARLVQLVGQEVTAGKLLKALKGAQTIFTYNGSRFDLPFIYASLGVDLISLFAHRDLMYDCWRCNLYGGFKAVEEQLGIPRQSKGLTGWDAVVLWQRYQDYCDEDALALLLQYNKEDVMNLKALREKIPPVSHRETLLGEKGWNS